MAKLKWRNPLIIFLTIIAAFLAYNYFAQPFVDYFPELETPVEVDQKSNQLEKASFENLTARQKVAQLLMVPLLIDEAADDQATPSSQLTWIADNQPGGVIYFGEEISFAAAQGQSEDLEAVFSADQFQPLIAVDHEGGTVQRLAGDGFTVLPSMEQMVKNADLITSEDEDALTVKNRARLLSASAAELSAVGINLILAPTVDYHPGVNPVLKTRIGHDPEAILTIAREYILAFSNVHIMPVIKHFPGIGSVNQDLHFRAPMTELNEYDTLIFEKILDQYPNIGLMSTHLRLKDKLAGQACSLSADCLTKVKEFYPNLLLITDDLTMDSARYLPNTSEEKSLDQVAIEAIEAGNHFLLFGSGVKPEELDQVLNTLEFKYLDSQSFRQDVDLAVQKILALKN